MAILLLSRTSTERDARLGPTRRGTHALVARHGLCLCTNARRDATGVDPGARVAVWARGPAPCAVHRAPRASAWCAVCAVPAARWPLPAAGVDTARLRAAREGASRERGSVVRPFPSGSARDERRGSRGGVGRRRPLRDSGLLRSRRRVRVWRVSRPDETPRRPVGRPVECQTASPSPRLRPSPRVHVTPHVGTRHARHDRRHRTPPSAPRTPHARLERTPAPRGPARAGPHGVARLRAGSAVYATRARNAGKLKLPF